MKTIKMLGCLVSLMVIAATATAGDADELIELDKKWGESVGATRSRRFSRMRFSQSALKGLGTKRRC
jgi:hypothetical protein